MSGEQEPVLVDRQADKLRAQERAEGQVEWTPRFAVDESARHGHAFEARKSRQVEDGEQARGRGFDEGHGVAFFIFEDGAKDFVSLNEPMERLVQSCDVENAIDLEQERHIAEWHAGLELFEEPEPFLGKGEG